MVLFTAQGRGEAFTIVGIYAFIHKSANASPLLFFMVKNERLKQSGCTTGYEC